MQPENDDNTFDYKPNGDNLPAQHGVPVADKDAPVVPRPREEAGVSWSASEYIEHAHGGGWYFSLTLATAALAAAAFFIAGRDYFTVIIIIILGIIVGVSAGRKPRIIKYELGTTDIKAGDKSYPYKLFKSFALIHEEAISSISLMPTKRFMPPLSIYLTPQDEDRIVEALSRHLPYEERQMDPIERLSRRLRF